MSQQAAESESFEGSVAPAFPLALLEAMRSSDRPGEVLEDEEFMSSLPRRLGLTGVVETQMRRYEAAQRSGRSVRLEEVVSLIRLVLRRPDAEPIMRDTGHRYARWLFRRTPSLWQSVLHRAPSALALRSARRAARRALASVHAGSSYRITRPFNVRVSNCMGARLEPAGAGCAMVTGMLEELLLLYTGNRLTLVHDRCAYRGDATCEWSLPA